MGGILRSRYNLKTGVSKLDIAISKPIGPPQPWLYSKKENLPLFLALLKEGVDSPQLTVLD